MFNKVVRNLNQHRSVAITPSPPPPGPQTLAEVEEVFNRPDVMDRYGNTDSGELFYRGTVTTKTGFTVFASPTIVDGINSLGLRHFHADSTYKSVPVGCFTQLLIFHVVLNGHVSNCFALNFNFTLQSNSFFRAFHSSTF